MSTDTTFFTNEHDGTLLDRFKKTLRTTQYFDVLVGYFRTSGLHRLYDAFEGIEKIQAENISCCSLRNDRPYNELRFGGCEDNSP